MYRRGCVSVAFRSALGAFFRGTKGDNQAGRFGPVAHVRTSLRRFFRRVIVLDNRRFDRRRWFFQEAEIDD